jgi:hypothetical protein
MMAAVCHVTSSSGLRKFQADGFLLDRVYKRTNTAEKTLFLFWTEEIFQTGHFKKLSKL